MNTRIMLNLLNLITIFLFLTTAAVQAQEQAPPEKNIRFSVDGPLLTRGSIEKDPQFGVILFLELDQGWHTYWRVPGDAGLAPRFDLSKSENIKDPWLGWQTPTRIIENDFQIFGYQDTAIFPVSFNVEDVTKEALLDLTIDVLICHEICIPEKFHTTVKFKPDTIEKDEAALANWDAVVDRIPLKDTDNKELEIENIVLGPDALVITAFAKDGFDNADLFAVTGDYAFTSPPKIKPESNNPQRAMIVIDKPADVENLASFMNGKKLEITMVANETAVEKTLDF